MSDKGSICVREEMLDIASLVSRETEQVGNELIAQPLKQGETAVVSMACSWSRLFNHKVSEK